MNENITPEMILIGSLFQDPSNWLQVRSVVNEEDFLDIRCAVLFKGIEFIDLKYDLVLLDNWLSNNGHSDLIDFALKVVDQGSPTYAIEYAKIVKENSRNRKLNKVSQQLNVRDIPVKEKIRNAEMELMSLYPDEDEHGFRNEKEIIMDYNERMGVCAKSGTDISGLTTGFRKIDLATDGLRGGELIIIGARPSIGKTSLMTQIADHISVNLKKTVAIFSLESSVTELFHKFVSQRARIQTKRLRLGKLNQWELNFYDDALMAYSKTRSSINDNGTQTLFSVRYQLKKLIEKGRKPDIVFLDYLQRMQVDKGPENYSIKMGAVTKGLKNIAKEMNIPFVALAQINRANGEAFPRIMDLKESGEIEADADIIILLHREEFYNRDCKEEQKGKIQVDIAKNRNGPLEFMSLNFEAQFTRITDSDRSDEKLEDD